MQASISSSDRHLSAQRRDTSRFAEQQMRASTPLEEHFSRNREFESYDSFPSRDKAKHYTCRYMVVDYERGNFSISQNTWTGTPPQLVPITAVQNGETDSTTTGRTNASTEKTISKGAIAAIVIVLVLGCLVAVIIAIILIRRKRRRRQDAAAQAEKSLQPEQINNFQKAEMDGSGKPLPGELDSVIPLKLPAEARGSFVAETEGDGIVAEVPGDGANIEMDVDSARAVMQRGLKPVEMDAGTFGIPEAPALNGKRGTNSLRKTQGASEERSSKKE